MRSLYRLSVWLMLLSTFSLIGIGHLSAQQHGMVKMNEQTLVVDLTEITSLSARTEVYDFFKSHTDFRIAPPNSVTKLAISSTKLTQSELLRFYEETVQRIVENDKRAGKDFQTNVLNSFASKYGYETADKLMRGVLDTENDSCRNSLPFCTDLIYNFPAGVNSGSGEDGPYYQCLGSTPNPAWYHMKIAIAGSLTIKMFSTPSRDIDFILWGPFDDPASPCVAQLTANKVIDCSYSTAATEYCDIANGILGKYYILLITNFSNQPCNITFQKTGGVGATDCTIVPPPIGSNSPVCYGDNIVFSADDFPGATYNWTGPNGWSSNQQNPVIMNSVMEDAGEYSLVITVNGSQSDPISTNVIVNALPVPEFSADDVCFGETTVFVNESTTNPDSYFITSQLWNFGDFQTSALENPTHTYANPGTYLVTLTTYTGLFNCVETVSHSVIVYDFPVVNAGEDQSIPNGWTTQLEGTITGGSGEVSYTWSPAEYLTDPNVLNPTTISLSNTVVFTLTSTDNISGCVSSDDVIVNVTGGALYLAATATPNIICAGESSDLFAYTSGGGGNYVYTWTSNPVGFTSDIPDPTVSPIVTTTYYVSVYDGQNTVNSQATLTVKPLPVVTAGGDQTINVGTSTQLSGYVAGGSGSSETLWSPADSLANPADLHLLNPSTKLLNNHTTFTLIANDNNGCVSLPDEVTIYTAGDYLDVLTSSDDTEICFGQSTNIKAIPMGGSGAYTYSWTANNSSWTYSGIETTVAPTETTQYTVLVNDGFKEVTDIIEIIVDPLPELDIKPSNINWYKPDTINVCVRDSVWLDAGANLNYLWSNGSTERKQRVITNGQWVDFQTFSVLVTNPATGCQSDDTLTVFFDFNTCNLGLDERTDISSALNVSPNPTNSTFSVSFDNLPENGVLYILDPQGKMIRNKELEVKNNPGGSANFNISAFKNGLYTIFYQSVNYKAVKQIIKY